MPKTITQKIIFNNQTSSVLYELYMDSKKHTLVTGAEAKINAKIGDNFSAYGGYIKGKNIYLIKNKLIVQTWRGSDWESSDPDSVFILLFEADGKNSIIYMTHANLPDRHALSIKKGWNSFYWKPWKKFLGTK